MGRPSASTENKTIAIEFAKAVTRYTGDQKDLLARCGRCSLFSSLQEMFPQVVRNATKSQNFAQDGLTEVEFNKLLQVQAHPIKTKIHHVHVPISSFCDCYRLKDSSAYETARWEPPINRRTRWALGSTFSVESDGLIPTIRMRASSLLKDISI